MMDEKRETSSELSSISGLSRQNRNEDGSDEKDELQDLASDVFAKDVYNVVPKDDDRILVTNNALPETLIGKDDVNYCEKRGGVHVDAVSNNISVLKPKEVTTESVVSTPEKPDPMRRWMEMKQNGFLSGPLGGPVASKPRKRKKRDDSIKKRNQVTKKEQHVVVVDRVSKVTTPPSGMLTDLKPGILRHVRTKEQVYSFLEALIQKANVAGTSAELNVRDSDAIPFTNPEQAKSLAVEAATVASQWLEFLHQDFSERLSALKDSRNRVDDTLKAELPLLVSSSKESSANQECTVTEAHRLKWSARFDQFKKDLHDEEKDLESALNQVKDMQSQCNEGLRQMNESSCGKDGTNQEINLAVQAAAASIFSTCRFILSKMKPPAPHSS